MISTYIVLTNLNYLKYSSYKLIAVILGIFILIGGININLANFID